VAGNTKLKKQSFGYLPL
jgi:hypothetical protein